MDVPEFHGRIQGERGGQEPDDHPCPPRESATRTTNSRAWTRGYTRTASTRPASAACTSSSTAPPSGGAHHAEQLASAHAVARAHLGHEEPAGKGAMVGHLRGDNGGGPRFPFAEAADLGQHPHEASGQDPRVVHVEGAAPPAAEHHGGCPCPFPRPGQSLVEALRRPPPRHRQPRGATEAQAGAGDGHAGVGQLVGRQTVPSVRRSRRIPPPLPEPPLRHAPPGSRRGRQGTRR